MDTSVVQVSLMRDPPPAEASRPPPAGITAPPDHLSPIAADLWCDIVADHAASGTLSRLDLPGLEILCETYADWVLAKREMADYPKIVASEKGPQIHPAYKILRSTEASLRSWLSEYGMTPLSRARLRRPDPVPKYLGPPVDEIDLTQLSDQEIEALRQITEGRKIDEIVIDADSLEEA